MIIFGVILVPLLNDFWDGSDNIFAYNYVSMYRALTEKETLAIIVFQVFNVLGIKRFYFSTLLLLDFVTLSDRLQNVARAVITPIMDLILVFTLMIFVAFIFASYGMFFFGQYYVLASDDMTIRTGRVVDGVVYTDDEYAARVTAACERQKVHMQPIEEAFKSLGFDPSGMTKTKRPKTEQEKAQKW